MIGGYQRSPAGSELLLLIKVSKRWECLRHPWTAFPKNFAKAWRRARPSLMMWVITLRLTGNIRLAAWTCTWRWRFIRRTTVAWKQFSIGRDRVITTFQESPLSTA